MSRVSGTGGREDGLDFDPFLRGPEFVREPFKKRGIPVGVFESDYSLQEP